MVVRVVDENGLPIASAHAYVCRDARWSSCGSTDSDGAVTIAPSSGLTSLDLAVVADGFVPQRRLVPLPLEREALFVLKPAGEIRGEVRLASGSAPRKPVEILAVERQLDEGPLIVDRREQHDPTIRRAVTDTSGSFTLGGLDPGACYDLHCGGGGYAGAAGVFHSCVAPGAFIRIEAARLFAATVEFVDRERGAIDPRLGTRTLEAWSDSASYHGASPSIWLSGLDVGLRSAPRTWMTYAFARGVEGDSDPVVFRLDHEFAGYSAGVEHLECADTDQPTPHYVVELSPVNAQWGSLEVKFEVNTPNGVGGARRPPRDCLLDLTTSDGARYSFELGDVVEGREAVVSVPCGGYEARVRSHPFSYPARRQAALPLVVRRDEVARLLVPYYATGGIRLELSDSRGAPYRGAVLTMLAVAPEGSSRPQSRRMALVRSLGPPHIIEGLEPQAYLVRLDSPEFRDPTGAVEWGVVVRAGEETVCEAVLSRP